MIDTLEDPGNSILFSNNIKVALDNNERTRRGNDNNEMYPLQRNDL